MTVASANQSNEIMYWSWFHAIGWNAFTSHVTMTQVNCADAFCSWWQAKFARCLTVHITAFTCHSQAKWKKLLHVLSIKTMPSSVMGSKSPFQQPKLCICYGFYDHMTHVSCLLIANGSWAFICRSWNENYSTHKYTHTRARARYFSRTSKSRTEQLFTLADEFGSCI